MGSPPRPTDAELEILNVLWNDGPSTVREVQAHLSAGRASGYTTVLKFLQIMFDKGLVERDESQRAHVYAPAESRETTQRSLVGDLLARGFSGSAEALVLRALEGRKSTPGELDRIRDLLDRLEAGR